MSQTPSTFIWHDLITPDVEAAKSFYARVIGWNMQAFPSGHDYTVLSAGTVGMGGIMAMPPEASERGAPPCWQGYIGVDDVDACAARIRASGGSVLRAAEDIPQVGRFALVADPQGAAFIIFKPTSGEAMPEGTPGMAGLVGWNELHAQDGGAAFDWYAQQFGWTQNRSMDMGPMGLYRIVAAAGQDLGGMMNKMPHLPAPFWAFYFNVDALDVALERVQQAGGQVMFGPQEVPGGKFVANCRDPQGAWFSLVAPRR